MKSEERGVQVEIKIPPLATAERRPHRRITATKRAEIIAALKVNGNAYAVARQVGGVESRSVWKIAKDESIELTSNRRGVIFRQRSASRSSRRSTSTRTQDRLPGKSAA
jgi:hypothetical protein